MAEEWCKRCPAQNIFDLSNSIYHIDKETFINNVIIYNDHIMIVTILTVIYDIAYYIEVDTRYRFAYRTTLSGSTLYCILCTQFALGASYQLQLILERRSAVVDTSEIIHHPQIQINKETFISPPALEPTVNVTDLNKVIVKLHVIIPIPLCDFCVYVLVR
ncbi:hypothetical protein CAPTEDRAFT_214963 [Capitella teleta]|uniref:Uncharacterized protein n=1 Tax=Capitella teleta TaxID=283909 RepID=R7TFI9_CAPTE|nr:hypothetical protein CAPTEDRAFT_214963 [Capitella teleta]|eukprot:ELT89796.1 hypothetical protein CAPTEDRAFT_214963 [Capitella teleta]